MECDVLIIGAGPAGAMTALLASRRRPDLRIMLVDAQESASVRPCGEFLAPAGVEVVAAAGLLEAVMATGAQPLQGVHIAGPHGALTSDYPRTHGLGIRRERFDAVLQDKARHHAELLINSRFTELQHEGDDLVVRLQTDQGEATVRTKFLIGADGRASAVRRAAGLDREATHRRFALACRANGIEASARVEMHLSPFGQIGIAALGDGQVNVNLLLAETSRGILKCRTPEQLLLAAIAGTPTLRPRCGRLRLSRVMSTGSLPRRSTAVDTDGIALVGDAAGFCDPFTGDGITFALLGAELLADTIAHLDFSVAVSAENLRPYAKSYRAAIGRRHSFGRCLTYLLARRRLAEHATAWLGRSRVLSNHLTRGPQRISPTGAGRRDCELLV